MFRTISIVAILLTLCGLGLNCLLRPCKECWRHPLKKMGQLFRIEKRLSTIDILRKLIYLLALLCFVILAITGFYPTLVLGEHISGYLLMIHATFAPIFAICLAVLAVMWAENCRLSYKDWPWFEKLVQRVTLVKRSTQAVEGKGCLGQKISFWLIIVLALPLILSVILSMFPYFGTYWQEILIGLHRYTSIAFALTVVVHTYLIVRAQME